jgi:hypothetical protein
MGREPADLVGGFGGVDVLPVLVSSHGLALSICCH